MLYGPTLWLGQDQLENRHLLYGVCGKEAGSDEVDWGGVLGPQIRGRLSLGQRLGSNTGISDRMMPLLIDILNITDLYQDSFDQYGTEQQVSV